MALNNTNLLIQMAQLPATFVGTPQELANEMVRRMKIVSPSGTNFIFIGDVEPSSNVGPWLKDGTKWYVFSDELKRYVPLDISDSERTWFFVQAETPEISDPPIWLRTTHTPTQADPSVGLMIGWYVFNGTNWIPSSGIVASGPSASRPSNPVEYMQFYDTDISCLIWFERAQWRTISGVPGDVKFVAFSTLTQALAANPGWELLGASNQNLRGRYISQATKDPGINPETDLTTDANVASRAAFEVYGETTTIKIEASALPYPPSLALWTLVKT